VAWRVVAIAGAASLTWAGTSAIAGTISGPHFEGYALIVGVVLVLQGILTIAQLIPSSLTRSSKVHQLGN
jgi:hypothetical protein